MATSNPAPRVGGASAVATPTLHAPYAAIFVEHERSTGDGNFHFSLDTASSSGVQVTDDGEITITWPSDVAIQEVRLGFTLTSPADVSFDGIVLGWRGDDLPRGVERALTYRAVTLLSGSGAGPRSLTVMFAFTLDTFAYRLHVAYPDGASYSIDPKIYNEGNGGPPDRS